jgi:hypothetical protein
MYYENEASRLLTNTNKLWGFMEKLNDSNEIQGASPS